MKGKQLNTNGVMSPCKDCKKRHTACHDDCEDFSEYRRKIQKVNENRREFSELYSYTLNFKHQPEYFHLHKKK